MVFGTCPATCPHFHLPQSLTQPYSHVYCFPKSSTLSSSSRLREMAATPGPVHDAGWLSVWSECADWAAWVAGGDRLGEGQLEQVFQGEDLILHLPLPSMYLGSLQLDLDFLMGKQFQRLRPTIQGCYENRGCGRGSPNDPTNQGFSAWMMAGWRLRLHRGPPDPSLLAMLLERIPGSSKKPPRLRAAVNPQTLGSRMETIIQYCVSSKGLCLQKTCGLVELGERRYTEE